MFVRPAFIQLDLRAKTLHRFANAIKSWNCYSRLSIRAVENEQHLVAISSNQCGH